jgi:class 3 adenylate cyclase
MSERRLPEGVVTFLLTDVEEPTGHRAQDDVATAMLRQRELIAKSVAAHGGWQPLEQGEGGSTVSVFVSASGALAAAVDMVQALTNEEWPGEPVRVRVGIHTGEAEVDGSRVRGVAIHATARICALAQPRELLVSSTVRDLCAGAGFSFDDRGIHQLHGVPEPRQLYAVR